MIDIHMHIGKLFIGEKALTPSYLMRFMDNNGIEKSVLLPIENPEDTSYYVTTEYVLDVCRKYPDRFIPFCNVDPRRRKVYQVIKEYKEQGCKGLGEVLVGHYVDHLLLQKMYEICGDLYIPIILDLSCTTCLDGVGLPRFEKMIKKFPKTIFIGHGPHFWAEISSDVDKEKISGYPKGKIKNSGAVENLFSKYSNIYADLSALSGFNALTRDPEFGYQFLEKFYDKLFLGTDICHFNQDIPIISYLRDSLIEGKLSKSAYDRITQKNAEKILKLR